MPSIDAIEGIGARTKVKLRRAGIRTTEGLLKKAATRSGRREIARTVGVSDKQVLEWVNRADLMRVRGIGSEYSDLLEAAGVDTVKELRRRNPAALTAKMAQVNARKRLVRRLPTESMVTRWVEHAKQLEPIVRH